MLLFIAENCLESWNKRQTDVLYNMEKKALALDSDKAGFNLCSAKYYQWNPSSYLTSLSSFSWLQNDALGLALALALYLKGLLTKN